MHSIPCPHPRTLYYRRAETISATTHIRSFEPLRLLRRVVIAVSPLKTRNRFGSTIVPYSFGSSCLRGFRSLGRVVSPRYRQPFPSAWKGSPHQSLFKRRSQRSGLPRPFRGAFTYGMRTPAQFVCHGVNLPSATRMISGRLDCIPVILPRIRRSLPLPVNRIAVSLEMYAAFHPRRTLPHHIAT